VPTRMCPREWLFSSVVRTPVVVVRGAYGFRSCMRCGVQTDILFSWKLVRYQAFNAGLRSSLCSGSVIRLKHLEKEARTLAVPPPLPRSTSLARTRTARGAQPSLALLGRCCSEHVGGYAKTLPLSDL
jgi:hypothetical protein